MDGLFHRSCIVVFLSCLSGFIGCGSTETPVTDSDKDLIEELLGPENASNDKAEPADPVEPADDDDSPGSNVRTVSRPSRDGKRSSASKAVGDRLELRLREGDRFPLIKTIEQTLLQKSEISPALAHTKLELTLAITVEQVKSDAILLAVQYSRVSYEHDVNGQRLSYDSKNHQGEIPWDVVPYSGMIGNGFSFWLGRDNSIRELVGYQEFLERCVAGVPLERRQSLLSEISNRFGDDGVANFVDDSIGLLPYDSTVDPDAATRVLPGDVWTRERRLMQPVPVYLTSTYRLTAMNDESAEIDITGRVASGDAIAPGDNGRIRITGGHSLGRCVVDRATGLPLEMNLTRFITMKVTTSDRQEVTQEKTIVTTIRAFPEVRGPVARSPQSSAVRQVSGAEFDGPSASQISTDSGNTRSVQAVYPE